MPYTDNIDREPLNPLIDALAEKLMPGTVGDLNYTITRLAARFLLCKGLKYENVNAVAGVLQKVLAEYDARVTRPYEKEKIIQNGDIPEYAEIDRQITRMHDDILLQGIQKASIRKELSNGNV